MRSAIVITEEIDDIEVAVDELVASVHEKIGEFGRSTAAIVTCDADVDVSALGQSLHERLGCDVLGMTTAAVIERRFGYCDLGISLAVFTGDDVDFSPAYVGVIKKDSFEDDISDAYRSARAKLPDDPKLILMCAPYIDGILPEKYIETFDSLSDKVPLFGGNASDHYEIKHQKVFFNGEADTDGMVFLLISGNISPVFAMRHHVSTCFERRGTVTKSVGNRVLEVDGESFASFASKIMLIKTDETDLWETAFLRVNTPFIAELPDSVPGEQPVMRVLIGVDASDSSGIFQSETPVGTKLSVTQLTKDDLVKSCESTLELLEQRMEASPADRSALLIVSCNGRNQILAAVKNSEADVLSRALASRPDMEAAGLYALGEFCPTAALSDGHMKNRYHNLSFAVCAL